MITNGVDPALLRIVEKRRQERDSGTRRRRVPVTPSKKQDRDDDNVPDPHSPKHEIDDLA